MTDKHTTEHIPDEAVQAFKSAFHTGEAIGYEAQIKKALTSALPYLSAPCAVEVVKLNWVEVSYGFIAHTPFGTYKLSLNWGDHCETAMVIAGGEFPKSFHSDGEEAKAAAQADFERRILTCVVTKPVDVAAVREECAEVVENAVLSYHVADCAGLADWKAFEKGQESGLKFGAAAIRALSPNEPVGRAALAQGGGE